MGVDGLAMDAEEDFVLEVCCFDVRDGGVHSEEDKYATAMTMRQ